MLNPKLPSRRAIPAAVLFLVLAGCPPRVTLAPRPGETGEGVLARLETAEAKVVRVRGEARLKAEGKDGKVVLTTFVAAEAPARVHLEQLDFFGRPQVVLASDGAHFTLFDGQKGKWFRGPATAQTVARFFPIALSPPELAALLLGKAPHLAPGEPPALATAAQAGQHQLTLSSAGRSDTLWVSTETDRVESAKLGPPLAISLEFTEWFESSGARAPRRVKLARDDGTLLLELAWKDLELNGASDPSLFALSIPEGIVPVELDGRGEETALKPGAVPR